MVCDCGVSPNPILGPCFSAPRPPAPISQHLSGSHSAELWVLRWAPQNTVIIKILAKSFCPEKYHKQAGFDLLNAGAL